jgi:hypothetical protein
MNMNSDRIKPIKHFKATEKQRPRNAYSFSAKRQSVAMLKILDIGQNQIAKDHHVDGDAFFAELNELDRKRSLG